MCRASEEDSRLRLPLTHFDLESYVYVAERKLETEKKRG